MAGSNKPALVALRRAREQTIDALTEHFANDALDIDEFEQRVDLAHRATSVDDLTRLVEDLQPVEEPATETALAPRPDAAVAVPRPERKRVVAIMGGTERKGSWVVPKELSVVTVMGGTDLDFRDAQLPPGVTEVKIRVIMGGVDVIVPPNVAVEAEGFAIVGGFEDMHRAPPEPDPDRPLLRISGFVIMGGLDISTRLPNETRWQAIKRRRRERRALKDKARGALPSSERKRLTDGSDEA